MAFHFLPFLSLLLFYSFSSLSKANIFTDVTCKFNCPGASIPRCRAKRALGNKVDHSFSGYVDVWTSSNCQIFATNILVNRGQAWPRMYEGMTYPLHGRYQTPGYPVRVSSLTARSAATRYISYSGQWVRRTNGPLPAPAPHGNRANGAYLWLNNPYDRSKWQSNGYPKWPYSVEVNIWNEYGGSGFRRGARRFKDYHDLHGKYHVHGDYTTQDGNSFYAYYLTLQGRNKGMSGMTINLKSLLKHLTQDTWIGNSPPVLKDYFQLIEVAVAAEGYGPEKGRQGADGKFIAKVASLGNA